ILTFIVCFIAIDNTKINNIIIQIIIYIILIFIICIFSFFITKKKSEEFEYLYDILKKFKK
ncbi:hypothetical protein, partial [Clostridium gallinarum]|uniref:hypothetical protein n=1 Tax=Clostridium gallinarum TaxID=2762246 RepID=UPI001A9AFE9B